MTAHPKKIREEDKDYKKYIETQPCLARNNNCIGDGICHHSVSRGAGGADYLGIPLCMFHHQIVHQIGSRSFQELFNIDFQTEIVRLLTGYIRMLKSGINRQ